MSHEPVPEPRNDRTTRIATWMRGLVALLLVVLLAYFGYIAYEGSNQLTEPPNPSGDCRTPATLGWEYEAINYDFSTDALLESEEDRLECAAQGTAAGDALTSPEGVRLAGWYVPSANGSGPTGPTVVLAHGWGSNKSAMLDRAAALHDAYNLVFFDFRNHGQSSEAPTTQGVREARDLRAVIDWLESTKRPDRIAVMGVSMGGASALAEAVLDERVDALVIESTHATLASAIRARLDRGGYPLSLPGSWATLLGGLIRTGEDISAVDPIQNVGRLDGRPLLLIYGGADDAIGRSDAEDLRRAAEDGGTPVELHVCADAGHAGSDETCPEDYDAWVLGFVDRALGGTDS